MEAIRFLDLGELIEICTLSEEDMYKGKGAFNKKPSFVVSRVGKRLIPLGILQI
jgi:hypothetical protein